MPHPTIPNPVPAVYCEYHVPAVGRQTVKSVLPSPSKSPPTGISVAPPHVVVMAPPIDLATNHSPDAVHIGSHRNIAVRAPLDRADHPVARLDDVPISGRRTEHRDVRFAVAIVIGLHVDIGRHAPQGCGRDPRTTQQGIPIPGAWA